MTRPPTTAPVLALAIVAVACAAPRSRAPSSPAPRAVAPADAALASAAPREAALDAATTAAQPSIPAPPASPFAALPGWSDDALADVIPAWSRTCERLERRDATRAIGHDGVAGTVADWRPACRARPEPNADHTVVRAYFERWFVPVPLAGADGSTGLFTGYYEPLLHGSRRRHGRFRVPLYARPSDLVTDARGVGRIVRGRLRPYPTRAQITAGSLRRVASVIAWVDDAIEAFFLEIQGSGRLDLDDNTSVQLNYAASNGHRYVALGRVLIDRGALERSTVSLQSIRAWLAAHPREARAVMNQNPSYVFFRESRDAGSHGAEGVVLTPGRSMAVDPRFVPLGTPLFVDAEPLEGVGPIRRLVIAQDTGGAIRGAVRGALFWGPGPDAYDRAGRMRQRGRLWMLVPRAVAARRSAEGGPPSGVERRESPSGV